MGIKADNSGSGEDVKRFMLASGMMSSAYESTIWEELTGRPSVSTVSILNEAVENDNPLLAITDANMAEAMGKLSVSPETESEVRQEALAGNVVIIPQESVQMGDWKGTGYLAKKQLAKYAEKHVAKKLGTELCERLLKDGADWHREL